MNQRRLEVEAIRDSIVSISGELKATSPNKTSNVMVGGTQGNQRGEVRGGQARAEATLTSSFRSVYLPVIRDGLPSMFSAFDFAEPSETNGKRDVTTVPTQALFMMNNPFVIEAAESAAKKMLSKPLGPTDARIQYVHRQTLGRKATKKEVARFRKYLASAEDSGAAAPKVWGELYQVMMATAEFRYLK